MVPAFPVGSHDWDVFDEADDEWQSRTVTARILRTTEEIMEHTERLRPASAAAPTAPERIVDDTEQPDLFDEAFGEAPDDAQPAGTSTDQAAMDQAAMMRRGMMEVVASSTADVAKTTHEAEASIRSIQAEAQQKISAAESAADAATQRVAAMEQKLMVLLEQNQAQTGDKEAAATAEIAQVRLDAEQRVREAQAAAEEKARLAIEASVQDAQAAHIAAELIREEASRQVTEAQATPAAPIQEPTGAPPPAAASDPLDQGSDHELSDVKRWLLDRGFPVSRAEGIADAFNSVSGFAREEWIETLDAMDAEEVSDFMEQIVSQLTPAEKLADKEAVHRLASDEIQRGVEQRFGYSGTLETAMQTKADAAAGRSSEEVQRGVEQRFGYGAAAQLDEKVTAPSPPVLVSCTAAEPTVRVLLSIPFWANAEH